MKPRRMLNIGVGLFAGLFLVPSIASASRGGAIPGVTGSPASGGNSCQACHGNSAGAGSVQILGLPAQWQLSTTYNLTVNITDPNQLAPNAGAGFELSAESPSGTHLGTIVRSDMTNTRFSTGSTVFLTHTTTGVNNSAAGWGGMGNMATYNMQWQSPATDVGPVTFWAAGNAINNNLNSSGDIIYLTNVTVPLFGTTGACCNHADGTCQDGISQANCSGAFQEWTQNDFCANLSPPCQTEGACCNSVTGTCQDSVLLADCSGPNLTWTAGTLCANLISPCEELGACCDSVTGTCTENESRTDCENQGFRFGGGGSTCATINPPCQLLGPDPLSIRLEVVVTGLTAPLGVTHAGDDRLFIVDQVGYIRVVENGILLPAPFLDVTGLLPTLGTVFDERGLLGLAFHPSYSTNGKFYIRYSKPRTSVTGTEPCDLETFVTGCHEEILSQFSVLGDPATSNVADATSEVILFRVDEPQFNHNGGDVAFGPDGFLYFSLGDGGGANDGLHEIPPSHGLIGSGQNLETHLGKMLRIDVDTTPTFPDTYVIPPTNPFVGVAGLDEIWAYGLRNPYKFSFDRSSPNGGDGAMFLSDVGQDLFEEVNIGIIGANYGWVIREGKHCFDPFDPGNPPATCDTTGKIDPIYEYTHAEGGLSVIGGYVYRGEGCPNLVGKYIHGDFSAGFFVPSGRLYWFDPTADPNPERAEFFLEPNGAAFGKYLKGFGEDKDREVYICASDALAPTGTSGVVYRIATTPTAPTAIARSPRAIEVNVPGGMNPVAIVVTPDCVGGAEKYVGTPSGTDNAANLVDNPALAAFLRPDEWSSPVIVTGFDITPSTSYKVQTDCGTIALPHRSAPSSTTTTSKWADICGQFVGGVWPGPDGSTTFFDIGAIVEAFKGLPTAPAKYRADLIGPPGTNRCRPDRVVTFDDIGVAVDAFKGLTFTLSTGCAQECVIETGD